MATPITTTTTAATRAAPATHLELQQLVSQLNKRPIRSHDAATLTQSLLGLNGTADGLLTPDAVEEALAGFVEAFPATPMASLTSAALQDWCERAESPEAQHHRRATCSVALVPLMAYGLLSVKVNPLPNITLSPLRAATGSGWDKVRPLTPLELLASRLTTAVGRAPIPRAAMVAVSEGGSATSELAALLAPALRAWPDRYLTLPGHTKIAERSVYLDGWRARALDAHLDEIFDAETLQDPHRPVFYSGNKNGTSNAAQASSSGILLSVLKCAGFGQDHNIKPHSIRFGGVRTQLQAPTEAHPVQAARMLGLTLPAAMRYLDIEL